MHCVGRLLRLPYTGPDLWHVNSSNRSFETVCSPIASTTVYRLQTFDTKSYQIDRFMHCGPIESITLCRSRQLTCRIIKAVISCRVLAGCFDYRIQAQTFGMPSNQIRLFSCTVLASCFDFTAYTPRHLPCRVIRSVVALVLVSL